MGDNNSLTKEKIYTIFGVLSTFRIIVLCDIKLSSFPAFLGGAERISQDKSKVESISLNFLIYTGSALLKNKKGTG